MKTYDVFVSYRWVEPDQTWVREHLVPSLKAAGLSVCLDVEDFVPGRDLMLEMTRAGTRSRKAVCVLSPDYFEGNRMVGFESLTARRLDPTGQESKLIPLILRKTKLPEWIRGLIPIDWTSPPEHDREWKKLLKVLGAKKLSASKPEPVIDHGFTADPMVLCNASEVVKLRKHDRKLTEAILRLEDESFDCDEKRHVVINREHYASVKSLLDDLYMKFLHKHAPPYTYGAKWLVTAQFGILAPFSWLNRPGSAIQDVDLEWINTSLKDYWRFSSRLSVLTGKMVRSVLGDGVYGVLVNSEALAGAICGHPKSAHYLLQSPDLFDQAKFKKTLARAYKHQFLFSFAPYRDLAGKIFTESPKLAKNPKLLQKAWKVASRLA